MAQPESWRIGFPAELCCVIFKLELSVVCDGRLHFSRCLRSERGNCSVR